MVRAILDNRKTVTRRVVKPQPLSKLAYVCMGYKHGTWGYPDKKAWKYWDDESFRLPEGLSDTEKDKRWTPPCRTGDILYVQETWTEVGWFSPHIGEWNRKYEYKTSYKPDYRFDVPAIKWRPSIHMPREAARIFLRVTDVRVERLQDIFSRDIEREGIDLTDLEGLGCITRKEYVYAFQQLWDSTLKPKDRTLYGWKTNPWVWVIEFERISKEEASTYG